MSENKEVLLMLQQISGQINTLDAKVDEIHRDAVKAGAKAGAITGAAAGAAAGAVSSGLVSTNMAFIKAQLGL